uniref:Uncharacterized protein n=1 Tax=Rhizophora mucronata TaxID=61149 RepID=A0A2P2NEU0_RHIMU
MRMAAPLFFFHRDEITSNLSNYLGTSQADF